MLLLDKKEVKLQKQYNKILYLSTAFQDTFVFLGMPGIGKDSLVHCDANGKILYEHHFKYNVDSFGMLSDREVMVLETHCNKITTLNLENHKISEYDHQFAFEQSDQSDIQTFSETRVMCVREQGRYNENRFRLTYYSYPLQHGNKPIAEYESQQDEWTYEYHVRKANNHSMIVWFKSRHDEEFDFRIFDLYDDPKGHYRNIKIKNTIGEPYNMNRVECALTALWEMKRGIFCAVCITNKTQLKMTNKEGVVNNNFILDLEKQTVREANFWFEPEYNDFQIDYMNLGNVAMFRTFLYENGQPKKTPTYYVSNETESIVAQDEWYCSYKSKYFIPGFDSSMIIEGQFENGDVSEFTSISKKILDPKEIHLHFLLHLNEDFDDDLLKDAIELLDNH